MATPVNDAHNVDASSLKRSRPSPSSRRAKVGRYIAATAIGMPANLTLYALLLEVFDLNEAVANLSAAALIVLPRFAVNKWWVWKHRSRARLGFEMRVHMALTMTGLALSTLVAWRLGSINTSTPWLLVGNVSSFAVIWLARFLVFDQLVFVSEP